MLMLFCLNKYPHGYCRLRPVVDNVYLAEAGTHLAQRQRLVDDYKIREFNQLSFCWYGMLYHLRHYKSTFQN